MLYKTFDASKYRKVYAVGDLHGCYTLFMKELEKINFDFQQDLIVSVGDFIDRGYENLECIQLLSEPWFISIRGNHEDICIRGPSSSEYKRFHKENGGEWFYLIKEEVQFYIIKLFEQLPIALELNFQNKKIGFVHAHLEQNDWLEFKSLLLTDTNNRMIQDHALWGCERINIHNRQYIQVSNIDAVILGHTVFKQPFRRDNCYYIDTGAGHGGKVTLLDLSTLV